MVIALASQSRGSVFDLRREKARDTAGRSTVQGRAGYVATRTTTHQNDSSPRRRHHAPPRTCGCWSPDNKHCKIYGWSVDRGYGGQQTLVEHIQHAQSSRYPHPQPGGEPLHSAPPELTSRVTGNWWDASWCERRDKVARECYIQYSCDGWRPIIPRCCDKVLGRTVCLVEVWQ